MRKLFKTPLSTAVCKHLKNEAPHVLTHDFCDSCNVSICYLCSQNHCINLCHTVRSTLRMQVPFIKYSTSALDRNASLLNEGHLTELTLDQVSCTCGVA